MITRRTIIRGTLAATLLEGTAMSASLGAPMSDVELDQGIPGTLGAASIGIMGIADNAKHARVSLGWQAGAIAWTTSLNVQQGTLVPTPGQVFQVKSITKSRVVFTPAPDQHHPAAQPGALLLVAGDGSHEGGLRFGNTTRTSSMIAANWQPSETAPTSVTLDWWPGIDTHDYADRTTIQRATVTKGATITTPDGALTVMALEGASALHPAWVVLGIK